MADDGLGSSSKGSSLMRFSAAVAMASEVLHGHGIPDAADVSAAILACYRGIETAEKELASELERERTPARIGLRKD